MSRRILFLQKLKFHIYVCLLTIVLKMLPMTFKLYQAIPECSRTVFFLRCNRRGSPTTILIHLCVALTVLSVLLLIVQYLGDAMTRTGCTVCNVLRYYIVFVSLMWNAVEAFNMYLMLLKVFDSNVRKFAWKAGVIAWGR